MGGNSHRSFFIFPTFFPCLSFPSSSKSSRRLATKLVATHDDWRHYSADNWTVPGEAHRRAKPLRLCRYGTGWDQASASGYNCPLSPASRGICRMAGDEKVVVEYGKLSVSGLHWWHCHRWRPDTVALSKYFTPLLTRRRGATVKTSIKVFRSLG